MLFFKKSAIEIPILLIVYFIFGTIREHGDTNAGGMYPIVFAIPGIAIVLLSNIL